MFVDFRKIPLLRFVIPFILGIIFALYSHIQLVKSASIGLLIFAVLLTIIIAFVKEHRVYGKFVGGLFGLLFFIIGFQLLNARQGFYRYSADKNTALYFGKVYSQPEIGKKTVKVGIEIEKSFSDSVFQPLNEKIIAYFKDTVATQELKIGDKITFYARLDDIDSPKNPGEFNYKKYLYHHYIRHNCFVEKNNWKFLKAGNKCNVFRLAASGRKYLMGILKKCDMSHRDFSVAEAILIGGESDIDGKVIRAYSGVGVIHVLSVSGLHVGIVYIVLNFLLQFLDKKRLLRWLKFIIIVLFLWSFAFISGLSASVMRAAVMFSFIVLAKTLNRHSNIYNTIAASAFVLLCLNPMNIMDVGFQLSYLAVLGIIAIYPIVYHLWYVKSYVLDKIWAFTCVSIAAQLSASPLSIFYFHQFPNLFFFSNLLVIPLVTVILYLGIAFFSFHAIPYLSTFLGKFLNYSTHLLNHIVFSINAIPYSSTKGLYINSLQVILFYGVLLFLLLYVYSSRKKYLFPALAFFISFLFLICLKAYKNSYSTSLYVYQINHHTAINFISQNQNILIADSALLADTNDIRYHIRPNWNINGKSDYKSLSLNKMNHFESSTIFAKNGFISINGKTLFVANDKINGNLILINKGFRIPINLLIITNDYPIKKLKQTIAVLNPNKIILDGSNSYYYRLKIQELKNKFTIDTKKSGAFFYNLK